MKLLGTKIGMTQIFSSSGEVMPVTIIRIAPHTVIAQRSQEKNGYNALVLGVGNVKKHRVSKPYAGQFSENQDIKKQIFEVRNCEEQLKLGEIIEVNYFDNSTFVDASGISKGKGTQGVIKRWGFKGGRATHGSKFHRANGSIGMAATPSKVLKGIKMAGKMGNEKVTIQNLKIVKIDVQNHLLLVKGSVPGANKSEVFISSAKKKVEI